MISAYKYQLEKLRLDLGRVKLQLAETREELSQAEGDLPGKAFEADKEEAIAAIKQLELNTLRGKLIDAEEVELGWIDLITNCVTRFGVV